MSGTPVIAVLPCTTGLEWPTMKVQVHVTNGNVADDVKVWLASPGAGSADLLEWKADKGRYGGQQEHDQPIKHMDGIVILQWGEDADPKLWVAEFSYGGNPPTTVRSPGAPISAGSSDGNLMIFSRMGDVPEPGSENNDDYKTCIVTTRNYGSFEVTNPGQPAGYLFSVASSGKIDIAKLNPTIVMYHDSDAADGGDLVIHRYDGNTWIPLPTYMPGASAYVATPIDDVTAPNLVLDDPPPDQRVEYYRLFSIKP